MPESLNQPSDAAITRTLKFGTLVAPAQQETAKERLLRCAASQTPLPPLECAPTRATLRDRASTVSHRALRLLNLLFVDSHAYERARRLPRYYQYFNVHGHYAFSVIPISA